MYDLVDWKFNEKSAWHISLEGLNHLVYCELRTYKIVIDVGAAPEVAVLRRLSEKKKNQTIPNWVSKQVSWCET